jgi:hypothetical protein
VKRDERFPLLVNTDGCNEPVPEYQSSIYLILVQKQTIEPFDAEYSDRIETPRFGL